MTENELHSQINALNAVQASRNRVLRALEMGVHFPDEDLEARFEAIQADTRQRMKETERELETLWEAYSVYAEVI